MATPLGRGVRILAGIVLGAVGLLGIGGTAGAVLAVAGLIPLAAGVFDVCLLAPLIGAPFRGSACRTS